MQWQQNSRNFFRDAKQERLIGRKLRHENVVLQWVLYLLIAQGASDLEALTSYTLTPALAMPVGCSQRERAYTSLIPSA